MSTHAVNIIEIKSVRPPENPETISLEIVDIDGWQTVIQKGSFKVGDHAIFVEPDYQVDTSTPAFSFLRREGDKSSLKRVRAIKLRGELSYGLLIKVPPELSESPVGTNVMEALQITRWEPPQGKRLTAKTVDTSKWPKLFAPKFDLENYQNHVGLLKDDEEVIITEKIHGANARYVFCDDVFYVGSRNLWVEHDNTNVWSKAANADCSIENFCRENPEVILYGEVYGDGVQSLSYGVPKGEVRFVAFAASYGRGKIDASGSSGQGDFIRTDWLRNQKLPHPPKIYQGLLKSFLTRMNSVIEEDSLLANYNGVKQLSEGVVIVPVVERKDRKVGRVALKRVSSRYLTSKH
jgi:RNA ligase (TIGR02306 family)